MAALAECTQLGKESVNLKISQLKLPEVKHKEKERKKEGRKAGKEKDKRKRKKKKKRAKEQHSTGEG